MRRLKNKELPIFKKKVVKDQGGTCPLCGRDLSTMDISNIVLDHDHETGKVRGALCRQCNGSEGKVKTQAVRCSTKKNYKNWIKNLSLYLDNEGYNYLHPTHRTESEKRALRNKRARARYKASKKPKQRSTKSAKSVKVVSKQKLFKEIDEAT